MPRFDAFCQWQRVSVRTVCAGVLLLACGCMQVPRAPVGSPHRSGSGFAPQADPFLDAQPQTVPQQSAPVVDDEAPQPTFEEYSEPTPVETQRPLPMEITPLYPDETDTFINPNVQPPRLEAPTIVPQAVTVPLKLELNIEAPERNLVGEISMFEITLQNPSDQTAEEVTIESQFEAGFIFPGSSDRQVKQNIGTLQPGESRDLKLSLRSDRAGYHCVEFRLMANGAETITKKACVEYQDSEVSVDVQGPAKRMVGGNAEWNLTVLSRDSLPVTDALVTVKYDSTYLKPVGGSEGAQQELGQITWDLGTLQISERVELQVEFECLMPIDSTCLDVKVTGNDNAEDTGRSCLAIERRTGALDVDLQDVTDPVQVGGESEYIITISNQELQSVHDLQVTATLPEMFRAVSAEVREAGQALSGIDVQVEGKLVRFDAVDVLAPDAELTYRIQVKALQAGTGRLLLSVSSDEDAAGKIRLEEVSAVVK